ncbi:MAG: glycoside hydrolase family 38 C-terminal domain-containing protein [Victivallales bacterium]
MTGDIAVINIVPTLFIKKDAGILKQLIRIRISNRNSEPLVGRLSLRFAGQELHLELPSIAAGDSEVEAFIPEPKAETELEASLMVGNHVAATNKSVVSPPGHWRVHIVQLSHHDLGYTGLPSNVLSKHARYLDQAIDMAEATAAFPDDAKFRIVLEQAWSVDHFLKTSAPDRAEKMIRLMQSGQFELTALFGNMTTELCGHESLIRTLYPSFRLKKKYGIPVVSAEHNDITGISWGLCRILCDSGIKIFCPGLPLYYNWADSPYQSFWNQEAVFGAGDHGVPGAFWWEAADGKRILFWCNNRGCGGSADLKFPVLMDALEGAGKAAYPGTVMRWPVQGGGRDNSPYILGFAESIKKWNETWEYPKLISSTNARFYEEFARTIPDDLPVHRGELPGQDYPVGAMSTARATALNRNNHHDLSTAEKLAVFAKTATDYEHQTYELENAREGTMAFEEHAWGHSYSHGPAMIGAEAEKALHSCRAAAYAHDVKQKALAKIADRIRKDSDDIHLVVFNPLGFIRSGLVRMPMRETENSEIIMEVKDGNLVTAALQGRTERGHLILPEEIISGNFELLDAETDEKIGFQLLKISADDPSAAFAAQRAGLAQGRKGYFNYPNGWDYDCCFVVENIPAMGYKTYRLMLVRRKNPEIAKFAENGSSIENEFYRITVDPATSKLVSVFDKDARRELIDSDAPHGFGDIVVRSPFPDNVGTMAVTGKPEVRPGKIASSISFSSSIHGHPVIHESILLYAGIKKMDFAVRILKDSTPLLDAHMAFPFAMEKPKFRYEGTLNVLEPVKDFLPGAYSDALAVQNWVEVNDGDYGLIWSSHDSPVAALGQLWPGYVSPAHSCVIPGRMKHPPQKKNDFKHGWIYSTLFNNNFCTNFSVTQNGEFIFRYSMTTFPKRLSVSEAMQAGADLSTPFEHVFSSSRYQGKLPLTGSYIKIASRDVILLVAKLADDGKGIVMRFWNPTGKSISTRIECPFLEIKKACAINLAEERTGREFESDRKRFQLEIKSSEVVSVCASGKKAMPT